MSQCIDCKHISMKDCYLRGKGQFGRCARAPKWEAYGLLLERECQRFQPAPPAEVQKRRDFLTSKEPR